MERQIEDNGNVRQNTTYSVNNIYLNGVRIAALAAEGETRFYLTDQVDSVSMVLSEQGKPLTAFEYLPYGETWLERVQGGLKEKHNPKYNSQELDTETDFYYYNARYYDPEISRFVTADTVIDGEHATQGWNRYMYVKGNPIRYSDPTGHRGSDNGNSFTGLAELANQFWNKVSGGGGDTSGKAAVENKTQKANDKVVKNSNNDKMPDFGSPLEGFTSSDQLKSPAQGGMMTSGTGQRKIAGKIEGHPGVDLDANEGKEIRSAAKGNIVFLQDKDEKGNLQGYGNYAVVQHKGGYSTYYGHMNDKDWQKYKDQYSKDSTVEKGAPIGGVGHSGRSIGSGSNPGNHLHFEIRKDWKQDQNTEAILRESMGRGG